MLLNTEMDAFVSQINLPLLTDIIGFVFESAEKDYAKQRRVWQRCILLDGNGSNGSFQEKYQFLYLGELLERYKERFGMTVPDRRAIALALGYTKDLTTKEMFVGNQKVNFLQEVRRFAVDDIYLTSALYLMYEGQSDEQTFVEQLRNKQYTRTEELLFVMSILPDFEQSLLHFKPQLLSLLGRGRNIPVFGNTMLLSWVIGKMAPAVKKLRTKDAALLRALCALPTSFVKKESRHHKLLLENGYKDLEIAYINMTAVLYQPVDTALCRNGITAEKIAVELFQNVLGSAETFTDAMYAQFSGIFEHYKVFRIKCYECRELSDALLTAPSIQNVDTFVWFSKYAGVSHPAFSAFDITAPSWDRLASCMEPHRYLTLFEIGLNAEQSASEIQQHIDCYNALTGLNYLGDYAESECGSQFSLLVEKGLIDLWAAFQDSLDANGAVIHPQMVTRMRSYLSEIKTIQAFRFYQKFLPQYGFEGYHQYLRQFREPFTDGLVKYDSYDAKKFQLKLHRDFLDDDEEGRRLLLHWVNEYMYLHKTSHYTTFITAVLLDDSAAALLEPDDLRTLYEIVVEQCSSHWAVSDLKKRYLTEEERQAEIAAQEAIEHEKARQAQEDEEREIQEDFAAENDGTIASLLSFMGRYRSKDCDNARSFAFQTVRSHLGELLEECGHELSSMEAIRFLRICWELADYGHISFGESQKYIAEIKEADTDAA